MLNFIIENNILLVANGDTDALKNIYDALGQQVYNLSFSILKDHHLAEDNAQDVFIKIFNDAKGYKKGLNAKAWIMSIARNNAIDMIRKRKNTTYTDFEDEEGNENTGLLKDYTSGFEADSCGKLTMEDALKTLEDTSREIVFLHLDTGLKFKEISKLLEMPIGTVTWKYSEAIKKLKTILSS